MKIKSDWILPDLKAAQKRTKKAVPYINHFELEDYVRYIGKGKKYYISTFGCQANQRDSETLAGILDAMNFEPSESPEKADVVLINTCAVRQNAEEKVLGEVGNLKRVYRENKDLVIGVCGCMAQEEKLVHTIIDKYPQVRLMFGTHNIQDLPNMLYKVMYQHERLIQIYSKEGEVYENLPVHRFGNNKAWVNIMYGCDKFCTYCIVPYTRGKERSRTMDEILKEVNELKNDGYKEITLLGQNVNAYGKDLSADYDFATLLAKVAETEIPRIRFMTSHPWDFSDAMIDAIAKYDNIMPFIHLPMQSGDTDVLKKMGRRYTAESYKTLFDKIKNRIPGVAISTDIIVGFPNETDEQFQHTLDMVNYCKFDNCFTFIYSPREGTPAAKMEDTIPMEEKSKRLAILNQTWNKYALEKNKQYEGKVVKVLVDGPSKKDPSTFTGYSPENKIINFTGENIKAGDFVDVYIERAKTFSMDGKALCYNKNK